MEMITPGLYVSAIATSADLLSDEEANIMIGVITGMEATTTQRVAIVESAVSERALGMTGRITSKSTH
jgi:hypothetical protein